jgi:hypothetical protein
MLPREWMNINRNFSYVGAEIFARTAHSIKVGATTGGSMRELVIDGGAAVPDPGERVPDTENAQPRSGGHRRSTISLRYSCELETALSTGWAA